MCEDCGCGDPNLVPVEVQESLLAKNDHAAAHNREHFRAAGVTAINLMGSPGSGKTALLEATAARLGDRFRLAAVSGDLATSRDADRLEVAGIPSRSITTGSACHLDAELIHHRLHEMSHDGLGLDAMDLFFIENVGNLVCPASFDLGQHRNVTLLSSPEGDDKPAKYPVMFRMTDLILLTKSDLIDVLGDFDPARATSYIRLLANPAPVLPVSARSGQGVEAWCDWLLEQVSLHRRQIAHEDTTLSNAQPDSEGLHTHAMEGR